MSSYVIAILGCGPGQATVVAGGSGTYGGTYPDDTYQPAFADVDSYAVGLSTPTLSVFYEQLSPYGRWIEHPQYGRVFLPAERDYAPYQNGQWVYSDAGWYWQSNEPIGWAVTHYGQWDLDATYGWVWVPGTEWAPAWVDWRTSGDMVGWAPRPPRRTTIVSMPERRYHFVQRNELTQPDIRRHVRRVDRDYVNYQTQPISRPTTQVPARAVPRHELQRVRGFDRRDDVAPPRRLEPRPQPQPPRAAPPPRVDPVPPTDRIPEPPRRVEPPRRRIDYPRQHDVEVPRVEPPIRAEPPAQIEPSRLPTKRVAPPADRKDRRRDHAKDNDKDDRPRPKKRHH